VSIIPHYLSISCLQFLLWQTTLPSTESPLDEAKSLNRARLSLCMSNKPLQHNKGQIVAFERKSINAAKIWSYLQDTQFSTMYIDEIEL
jgi:hypothetical protein